MFTRTRELTAHGLVEDDWFMLGGHVYRVVNASYNANNDMEVEAIRHTEVFPDSSSPTIKLTVPFDCPIQIYNQ